MIRLILVATLCLLPHLAMAEVSPGVAAYDAGDYARALTLLESEAPKGDPAAQTKLGLIHAKGLGVARDPELALDWFQKAAAQGHAEAEYCIGVVHDIGDGVPQDPATAVTWYRKAAEKGYEKAQFNLASMLREGLGAKKDIPAAAEWYRKAAIQDYADAQFMLARLYLSDDGLEPNMLSAKMWMDRAATLKAEYQRAKEIIDEGLAKILSDRQLPELAGGDGSSIEDAISFPSIESESAGVKAEYQAIGAFLPGWQKASQAVFHENGHIYDEIRLTKNGADRSIYFDITFWFGRLE